MSFYTADRIYSLLPAFYRIRDIELARQSQSAEQEIKLEGIRAQLEAAVAADPDGPDATRLQRIYTRCSAGPLRAVIEILAEQIAVLEENLEQLEDDAFIETCAEWVVPYIGELTGTRGLTEIPGAAVLSRRAQVANTLAYRRRKGTAAVLEQVARDLTNWDAAVVEFFQRLVSTQYMNHVRLQSLATEDVRNAGAREPLSSPFNTAARTVDVRRIAVNRGMFNIPNIGIFLFRIRSFSWTDVPAFRLDARRFTFHPLGLDTALFNEPVTEQTITHLATPDNVARELRRREVRDRLADFYGRNSSFALSRDGAEVPADDVRICDLSEWTNTPAEQIAIDPQLGRIAFPEDQSDETDVSTVFRYGFAHAMGGGEYGRSTTLSASADVRTVSGGSASSLQLALDDAASGGVVEITDSGVYAGPLALNADAGAAVELRAADRRRPVLRPAGNLTIIGGADSEVTLNGLLIDGGAVLVPAADVNGMPNQLRRLRLEHCTVRPGSAPISILIEIPELRLELDHAISGAVGVHESAEALIVNSIVDARDPTAIAYQAPLLGPGAPATIRDSTLIGKVFTRVMTLASNTIFLSRLAPDDPWIAPVRAERLQEGCVRFSFVPLGSLVPRRHRCQPESAAAAVRVRPVFRSLEYGDAGYVLLDTATPEEIAAGADDGAEMGAFHDLYALQRVTALRRALREQLRFGLEAGVFYAT